MEVRHTTFAVIVAVLWGTSAASLAAGFGPFQKLFGGTTRCAWCGRRDGCKTVCRLVQEERQIKVTCWSSRCKPVCLPGPSKRGCRHVEQVCSGQGKAAACGHHGKAMWYDWCPGTARSRSAKVLLRKTETIKVPTYRWVIEDLCATCQAKAEAEAPAIEPGAEVPPVPQVDARIIAGIQPPGVRRHGLSNSGHRPADHEEEEGTAAITVSCSDSPDGRASGAGRGRSPHARNTAPASRAD